MYVIFRLLMVKIIGMYVVFFGLRWCGLLIWLSINGCCIICILNYNWCFLLLVLKLLVGMLFIEGKFINV